MPVSYEAFRTAFEPGKHPRDDHGKFSELASHLGPKSKAAQLAAAAKPAPAPAAKPKTGGLSLAGLASALPQRHGDAVLSPQAYAALKPSRQRSAALRDRTLSQLGDSPDAKILADTLARWQDGGGVKAFRHKVDAYVNGQEVDPTSQRRAKAMLNAIRNTPPEMVPASLHRGLAVPGTPASVLAQYQPGSKVNLNLTSFSSDKSVARDFADSSAGKGRKTKIVMEMVGPKKALPIQNLSQSQEFFSEKEFVSAGRFEVVSAKAGPDGTIQLKIKQVAPL